MTLPNITFIKGQGGLGRPLPGADFISGLIFFTASLPSGFTSTARMKQLLALTDAESAGILNDYSDATAATGTLLITTAGATGDLITVKSADIDALGVAQSTVLCAYTKLVSDSSIALLGASLAAAINAGTVNHGYSATFLTATLTITGPKRLGIYLNTATTPLSYTTSGTFAATVTQFSGGAASLLAIYHYHISEFFRMQPGGVLYVGFFAVPAVYDFTEITTLQAFANGTIRQVGILKGYASAFASANLTTIDAVCKVNDGLHKPISALYAADLSGTADITTLSNLALLTANKASAVIGQDGGGQGNYLWLTTGKSITCLGTALGTVALAKVSESIAWVGQFPLSNGIECEVLAFANGQYFANLSATIDVVTEFLNAYRYIFMKKFSGASGSFFNDGHTAILQTSDYAYIENNRTIDKAIRGLYIALLPSLNSPLVLNADGTLSDNTVAIFESICAGALDSMVRDVELSAYAAVINPAQNVLSTSKIIIAVTLVINGVARYIEVPIGFKPSIA